MVYQCPCCGEFHESFPALTFKTPCHYNRLPPEQKRKIANISGDFCQISYPDQTDLFIRATLTQKIIGQCKTLEYGIWVSLSIKSFTDYMSNFDNENHLATYFGWFSNYLPDYPDTTKIPTNVQTKTGNQRPTVIPYQDFNHPFVTDYYNGITLKEAERRVKQLLDNTKRPFPPIINN